MAQKKDISPAPDPAFLSREWLLVTLSSIGDAVITTDANGRVTLLNPVAQILTGWTQEEAVSRDLSAVFHIVNEETRAEVANPALRALKDGVIVGLANHTILISKDGTERPIDDSAAPIRNDRGEIAGSVLVFRDITERRRQEKLIKDAMDYAHNILETQREPFLVLSRDLRVVSANRSFCDAFQVEKNETEGRFVYDLGNEQWNIPALRELLEKILPKDQAFDGFEVKHHFEHIGLKSMLLNARRIRKPGNHSELILLAIEDITARRAAEQALNDSEVRYRRLFQSAKDGILILDAKTGKIIDANAFMSALVGLEPYELTGKELHEIGLFKDTEESKKAFRELQRTGYLRYEHLPVQNQRGETVEVEVVANVYQEDGRQVAQCNVRDTSERALLQQRIADQVEAIASESRRKDEFLAMLSHELRNPLAPIRSAVHVLKVQERGSENMLQRQAREIIERQVTNLTKLVSDLLEISRVVSGRIRIDPQTVDLNQILEHALETVKPLIEQRKHELIADPCTDPVWVNADSVRLEEVFVNLLGNAAKYTPDGGRIEVRCNHPRGSNHAEVRIRDNGVGIDTELLPRIFDLFTQAERSLDRSAGGLGIGLSLAHRLVDLHGGTIEAQSPPENADVGSEFIVRFPLTPGLGGVPHHEAHDEAAGESKGTRVLVVDDNVDMVTMLASSLRHFGYSVQVAHTGPDGLKSAEQWRPDVVLLDIGLPELDGYEVARSLRSNPEYKPKLIAITGYGRDHDKALAREAGFDAHMVKPYDFHELEKLIRIS